MATAGASSQDFVTFDVLKEQVLGGLQPAERLQRVLNSLHVGYTSFQASWHDQTLAADLQISSKDRPQASPGATP